MDDFISTTKTKQKLRNIYTDVALASTDTTVDDRRKKTLISYNTIYCNTRYFRSAYHIYLTQIM